MVDPFERHARVTSLDFDYAKCIIHHREESTVALEDFKITFRDGSKQIVTADQHRAEGTWIVFYDNNNSQVLRVPGSDVQSVSRSNVSDREPPGLGLA